MTTPPNQTETPLPLASWGHRLIAFLIDAVIIFVVHVVFIVAITPTIENIFHEPYRNVGESLSYFFFAVALAMFLTTMLVLAIWGGLFEGVKGRTPGKTVAGLKVVSAKDHIQTIGFARGIAREIVRSLPLILYFPLALFSTEYLEPFFAMLLMLSVLVFVLDHLWPLWDKERQTLHDKIAKSHVIESESVNKIYTILKKFGLGSLI